MSEPEKVKFFQISGLLRVGFAPLSREQLLVVNIVAKSGVTQKKPNPPPGYTHELALAHIATYREDYAGFDAAELQAITHCSAGASYLNYLDSLAPHQAEGELAILQTIAMNKGVVFARIDNKEIGRVLWQLAELAGRTAQMDEMYKWLTEAHLQLNQELVAGEIKSAQREGERPAPGGSEGSDSGPRPRRRPHAKNRS